MTRFRDTYEGFEPMERGLFGENELRDKPGDSQETERNVRLKDIKLVLKDDRPVSIAVVRPDKPYEKWIFLPKSQIEFAHTSGGLIEVTLPEWLARDKGLI